MTRKHESRWTADAEQRHLQAQINELWEVIAGNGPFPVDPQPDEASVRMREMVDTIPLVKPLDHDAAAFEVTAEIAAILKPDAYEIVNVGWGWYQVVNSDGKPLHKSKLRKDKAQKLFEQVLADGGE